MMFGRGGETVSDASSDAIRAKFAAPAAAAVVASILIGLDLAGVRLKMLVQGQAASENSVC